MFRLMIVRMRPESGNFTYIKGKKKKKKKRYGFI